MGEPRPRVAAIDILRGFVMVLMAIDHASHTFNHDQFFADSVVAWTPGSPIPLGPFLTRWITHLCAPTFVTLAGTALAISIAGRKERGATDREIDRHILIRGALIVAFELVWMSYGMRELGKFLCQVLYAIGASLMCMAFLRRLSDRALLALGLVFVFGSELFIGLATMAGIDDTLPIALLVRGGFFFNRRLIVAYPLLPWLAMMCLGWVLGRRVARGELEKLPRLLVTFGLVALGVFVVLRGLNGYGNMRLLRDGPGILQWLHVSKYPPSVTYDGLELGLGALLLAGLMRLGPRPVLEPLRVLGSTALFYYLLHLHLMKLVAWAFGLEEKFGMASAYVGGLAVTLALYPLCAWYRRYKAAHPDSLARFV